METTCIVMHGSLIVITAVNLYRCGSTEHPSRHGSGLWADALQIRLWPNPSHALIAQQDEKLSLMTRPLIRQHLIKACATRW